MLHIRTITPTDISARVVESLESQEGVFGLTVLPAAVLRPDGDVIEFDVLTSSANDVLAALRSLGVDRRGAISIETITTSISGVVSAAAAASPYQENAPVWEEVEATIRSQGTYPPSFYALLVISAHTRD